MKKTLLKASLWGILTLSLFYSCRTDSVTTEQTITSKEKITAFEKFERENNIIKPIASSNQNINSEKYISYGYPFAQVIYNFLQNHPDYAKKVENEAGTIRLDVVSQTFGQNKKSVIFPVVNNQGEVVGAWAGILNENRDYVSFYYLDNSSSQNVAATKAAFQAYYDKKYGKITNQATASIKGINPIALAPLPPPKVPVQTIQEVVINVPATDLTVSSSWLTGAGGVNYGNTLGGGMSGGPTTHGGGGTPNANQEIINNLKDYPYAQKLLEQLPNLNNSLAKLIEAAFKSNKKANVTFWGVDFADPLLQGEFKDKTTEEDKINGVLTFQIELSKKILKNSTQEYVLGVMYHEFVHAYLGYEFKRLGPDEYHRQYPYIENYVVDGVTKFRFITGDHQAYSPFINMIADAIQSYNPKFPRDRAIAIAMEGLTKDELPNNGEDYNTIERYSGDTAVGTKCSKP
ncbi:hypothetical protein BAX97_12740 [Elizabethkingia meningoseptica]|uniref:hypothetical protein n=1 Tax=Elizabethkingia meningoseptica TaxID=238 RepID=UPI00099A4E61|nr:hypothetical protein [Elizabethkingia meningoseptica]OPC32146.1 hypothetical protein BAX97_12740 [Elizabethkingia meningoseptica]